MRRTKWNDIAFPPFPRDNISSEWAELKLRLEEVLNRRIKYKEAAVHALVEQQQEEMQSEIQCQHGLADEARMALDRLSKEEISEDLFYELFAFAAEGISIERAKKAAAVIAFKKQKDKGFQGIVGKSKKINNLVYDTESALFVCEEHTLWEAYASVDATRYYYQHGTCFEIRFEYSLVAQDKASTKPKRVRFFGLVNGDELIDALERTHKKKTFLKEYNDIYAGLLMDR